jgi:hypothetical protein
MNNDDFERFKEFNAWSKSQPHHQQEDPIMGTIQPVKPTKQKRSEVLVPLHWIWAAGAGALVLLIAAWPFTLLGFFIGLFVRIKFFGDKS